ncbi:unnamed protein product [Penicillium salamii]|nr:unnamed protein product [Penicillium salamii]
MGKLLLTSSFSFPIFIPALLKLDSLRSTPASLQLTHKSHIGCLRSAGSRASVQEKISQHTIRPEEEETETDTQRSVKSTAEGTFLVQHEESNQVAFMRVYIQVPRGGTEFEDPDDRGLQASQCTTPEVKALKTLAEHHASFVPSLLAVKEDIQDQDGYVPGGYVVYLLFEKVHGTRIIDARLGPSRIMEQNGFLRQFPLDERDEIRAQFTNASTELVQIDIVPMDPDSDHLIWDPERSKLYFVDFRRACSMHWLDKDQPTVARSRRKKTLESNWLRNACAWSEFGLAISPANPRDEHDPSKWQL